MGRLPRRLGPLATVLVAATTALAQPTGVPAVVDKLLQGLASDSCPRRWQAIEEYIDRTTGRVDDYGEPREEVTALLRERARSASPLLERKVRDVTSYADEFKAASEQLAKLTARVERSGSNDDQWRQQLEPLAKVLDDPKAPYLLRRQAASLIEGTARKSESARAAGWDRPLRRLLESKNPVNRLVAVVQAAQGNLLRDQASPRGRIVPELIRGLDSDSFAARYDSARALLDVNKLSVDGFCVDPSDAPAGRASRIRAWRTWWNQNRDSTSDERLPQ